MDEAILLIRKDIGSSSQIFTKLIFSKTKLFKDAWLAAILALVYALLMVFAVITAIYCR